MDLIIGGFAQGKLEYAKKQYTKHTVVDDSEYNNLLNMSVDEDETLIWNNLHLCIRDLLVRGAELGVVDDYVFSVVARFPNLVIISDEIGNGIVPLDEQDRIWREATGRILCRVASESNRVVRVVCGIPTVLK